MIRNLVAALLLFVLASCATMPEPNPVFVSKIDAYFKAKNDATYETSVRFDRPIPYAVGQFVVTGMTDSSQRFVEKTAIVGKEGDGWIIERLSLNPSSEMVTQMLVRGMDSVQGTGRIDALEIDWIKLKHDSAEIQTIEGPALKLTMGHFKKALLGLECQLKPSLDVENVLVPAGSFEGAAKSRSQGSFMGKKYSADVWLHPSVPINGMVKTIHEDGDMKTELLEFGLTGAERSF